MKTLYEILEVSENASKEVIEKAYRVLAKKYHPDLQPESQKQKAEETIKKINEAYAVLSDETKRKEYDETLERKRLQEQNEKIQQELEKRKQATIQTSTWYGTENFQQQRNNSQENMAQNRNQTKEELKKQKKIEEQLQKNLQNAYETQYQEAYENYLKSLGYKIKYKWTWKNYKDFLITILIIAIIFTVLWFFPPTHNWIIEFYESNSVVKAIVDVIGKIFVGIWNAICTIFQ